MMPYALFFVFDKDIYTIIIHGIIPRLFPSY